MIIRFMVMIAALVVLAACLAASPPTIQSGSPVVVIVMENHEYGDIVNSPLAPYINNTLIAGGKLFTNYNATTHPSLPNYLAMTAGWTGGKVGTDAITAGEITGDNLFHQFVAVGKSWNSFEETMPSACYKNVLTGTSPYLYALKHDPAMAFHNIATYTSRCAKVVPYTQLNPSALPLFSFITPNECSDMHSCTIDTGDTWLQNNEAPLLAAGATVIVTFDEGTTSTGGGGHVLTVEDGPGVVAGSVDSTAYTHYSLLAGLENFFGLALLRGAKTATPLSL